MPQFNLYLDETEDKIISKFSKKWDGLSKHETIKKIIKEFREANKNE